MSLGSTYQTRIEENHKVDIQKRQNKECSDRQAGTKNNGV